MDPRLQYIAENFENMKLGPDEPFKFSCNQCGKCCINREDILLNALDVYRLSKELNMEPIDMITEYAEVYIGDSSRIPIVRLRPRGSIRRCRFLKDRKCSVHNAKPTVCAMFPVGRCIKLANTEDGRPDIENMNIEFIINEYECGTDETHTVREWFNRFGIPLDDVFFKKWNQTIMETSEIVRNAEGKIPESNIDIMRKLIYVMLYLNYNIEQDFTDQFEKNVKEMLAVLHLAPTEQGGK